MSTQMMTMRVTSDVRRALEHWAEANLSTMTSEMNRAVRERVERERRAACELDVVARANWVASAIVTLDATSITPSEFWSVHSPLNLPAEKIEAAIERLRAIEKRRPRS